MRLPKLSWTLNRRTYTKPDRTVLTCSQIEELDTQSTSVLDTEQLCIFYNIKIRKSETVCK